MARDLQYLTGIPEQIWSAPIWISREDYIPLARDVFAAVGKKRVTAIAPMI